MIESNIDAVITMTLDIDILQRAFLPAEPG
jgi:hypothetical protein